METFGRYVKFTPFYKYADTFTVSQPLNFKSSVKISKEKLNGAIPLKRYLDGYNEITYAGRHNALKQLHAAGHNIKNYDKLRDHMALDSTTHLSTALHFGVLSPREVYWELTNKEFRKQLYWREFYMYISHYVVKSYVKKSWTMPRFNKIRWRPTDQLKKWQHGKTGIPIVDAGMRELLKTGYMHNRARMICAMYLIHYLGIHWKYGEQWFARNLTDYSYSNNYGGWVWCAGIEVHSNPYFRIYSMEQQNRRFDPECVYVKKWCPRYKNMIPREIFEIYEGLNEVRRLRILYLKNL
jgi:deoxyribodipyrimidine photo-lyase